jgi:foldase protein PrsA
VTKALRLTSALGAVLFALTALAACGGGGIPGNAVVSVDSSAITRPTFKHWISVAAISGQTGQLAAGKPTAPEPPEYTACINHLKEVATKELAAKKIKSIPTTAALKKACEQQYQSLKREVLGFLISSEWIIGEAASLGVKVSDAEVKKQFLKIRTQQFPSTAEFEKFMASSGQTVSDLLLRVKLNMLSQKIQQKIAKSKVKVTQAQIQKYYNENKSRYGTPEKRQVQIILTRLPHEAEAAKKEVESGKSFASVAKAKSIDRTSKSKGGQLGEISKGQEEQALDTAIFSAKPHTLSGPVNTSFGFYIFEVLGTKAGTQQSLSQVQASIKQQLTATQQQTALSTFVKTFKKKWVAKTDCRSGYVVEDCKQYKAPKTGSTGTATK